MIKLKDLLEESKRPGIWANIRAKRARGEKPAKKGTKAYKKAADAMKKLKTEDISKSELDKVEQYADKLFKSVGIDVEFTRHFLDRVNDPRNDKPISSAELIGMFRRTYKKYGKKIPKLGVDAQAVITDMSNDINVPFVLQWDKQNQELDLVSKTVMRKKNFQTSNQKLEV